MTDFNLNEWLAETQRVDHYGTRTAYLRTRDWVRCADGFLLSIQASALHYCEPRDNSGPYTACEVGFPSEAEPLLMEWAEDANDPTDTVYAYVPVGVIEQVIAKHGGMEGTQPVRDTEPDTTPGTSAPAPEGK